MPEISIDSSQLKQAKELIKLIKIEFAELSDEGRKVFVVMLIKELGPQIKTTLGELKSKASNG